MRPPAIDDAPPVPIRVIVASATGLLRQEIVASFDEEFWVEGVPDARSRSERTGSVSIAPTGPRIPEKSIGPTWRRPAAAGPGAQHLHRKTLFNVSRHPEPG